jgi:uncharacterized protein YlzI (FlbEa/FlbD family)
MPMLKVTLPDGDPIWINPNKVAAVQRAFLKRSSERTHIYIDVENYWAVQESVEDVVAKSSKPVRANRSSRGLDNFRSFVVPVSGVARQMGLNWSVG